MLGAKSFENVREDFASGSEGVLKIQNPGDSSSAQYLAYTPLGMNDWIICYIVPVSSATEQYSFFQAYEVTFIGVFLVLVCLLVMYIFHQNDQKNQDLLYTAQRDGLTNLYNKRYTEYKAADVQLYQTKHEGGNGFHLTPEKE